MLPEFHGAGTEVREPVLLADAVGCCIPDPWEGVHCVDEHSTFTWLLEPMVRRAGFEVEEAQHSEDGGMAQYVLRAPLTCPAGMGSVPGTRPSELFPAANPKSRR